MNWKENQTGSCALQILCYMCSKPVHSPFPTYISVVISIISTVSLKYETVESMTSNINNKTMTNHTMAAVATWKLSLQNMCLKWHLWCSSIRKVINLSLTKLFSHEPSEAESWHFNNVSRNGKFYWWLPSTVTNFSLKTWVV